MELCKSVGKLNCLVAEFLALVWILEMALRAPQALVEAQQTTLARPWAMEKCELPHAVEVALVPCHWVLQLIYLSLVTCLCLSVQMARDCISQIFSPAPSQGIFNSLFRHFSRVAFYPFISVRGAFWCCFQKAGGRQGLAGPQASM